MFIAFCICLVLTSFFLFLFLFLFVFSVAGSTTICSSVTLSHLRQIKRVWPECFELRPILMTFEGKRLATYELTQPQGLVTKEAIEARISIFKAGLSRVFEEHVSSCAVCEGILVDYYSGTQSLFILWI